MKIKQERNCIKLLQGIYKITINNKSYIGKDSQINLSKRKKEHLNLLKNNKHYNKYLQNAYNKYNGKYQYEVLFEIEEISTKELSKIEIEYIEKYDTFNSGYNLTTGGEGMGGYKYSERTLKKKSENVLGEKNPQSKLKNYQFYEIVEHLKQGKTNDEIAEIYDLHPRYVSLIRHKKRFKSFWKNIKDYEPKNSSGNDNLKSLSYIEFLHVIEESKKGVTNKKIADDLNICSSTVSRIKNKKIYKEYWKIHLEEIEGSTTIESKPESVEITNDGEISQL